jgi:hypothetical protein
MVIDFMKSIIYEISSINCENIYIGSTSYEMKLRLYKHKQAYKSWLKEKGKGKVKMITAFKILQHEDCIITLLEKYPCKNREELRLREGEWILENKNICVNKRIAGRIPKNFLKTPEGKIIKAIDNKRYQKTEKGKKAQKKANLKYRTKLKYPNSQLCELIV